MAASSLFDLAQSRLAWLDRRQSLLAQNIANADTPHFHPKDLSPFMDQLNSQFSLAAARTNPAHLAFPTGGDGDDGTIDSSGPVGIDGNAVQLEKELTKVAQTDSDQELTSDLFAKYATLYRTTLGR